MSKDRIVEEKKVVKDEKFDAFWANYKSQYPLQAKLTEENGELEKIKADFQKSLIN